MNLERYKLALGELPLKAREILKKEVIISEFSGYQNSFRLNKEDNFSDGIYRNSKGQVLIRCTTEMSKVEPKMIDWWFGWHMPETERYKLWHPRDHVEAQLREDRSKYLTDKEKYIGADSYVKEYIGKELNELCITFHEPYDFGFPELDINKETAICAHVVDTKKGLSAASLTHLVIEKEGGSFMVSTFWLGMGTQLTNKFLNFLLKPILNIKAVKKSFIPDKLAKNLLIHCYEEMNHLSKFLPDLYKDLNPH